MKTLLYSIVVIFIILSSSTMTLASAQNNTNSSNQIPPGTIRTSNGGWITPLQTTTENGSKLTIHYETGVPVTGNHVSPGPGPVIHMNLQSNSQIYEKGDMITISGQEDNYLIQTYGNNLTLSIDSSKTGEHWCCDNFQSSNEGSFYYMFKMPDMFQSSDNYNIRINPHNSTDQYGVGILYYDVIPRPLEQIRLGVFTLDVECRDNLVHVIKSEDKSPACVKQDDLDELVHRGWAQPGLIPSKRTPHIVPPLLNPVNLSQPCEIPYPQPNNGIAVLYMPANSTGKICVQYSNSNSPQPAGLRIFEAHHIDQDTTDVTSYATPDKIQTGNSTIVYTVTTGNHAGFYGLTIFCVGMPFAVGYDSNSTFVEGDFPWFGGTYYCPAQFYNYHIVGLSGIGVKYIPYQ